MSGTLARKVISLDGEWRYRTDPEQAIQAQQLFEGGAATADWQTMDIPDNWYLTELGDYHGVVWFAREFEVDSDAAGKELVLRFNGVDYLADVWLNGKYLGRHEGFFAPFEFRVTGLVKAGSNALVVRVDSPKDETEYRRVPDPPEFERPLSDPYKTTKPVALTTIKGSLIDFWHRPGWETQWGQDGNTGGIWKSVALISTGGLTIRKAKITPTLVRRDEELDGTALVTVDLNVYNPGSEPVTAEIALEAYGKTFESDESIGKKKEFVLTPGENRLQLVQTVEQPVLWWCWDHGEPHLYEMKLTAATGGSVQDEITETFGIRELVVDEKGHWILNGRRVFARGMRYHSAIWLAKADEKLFREDLDRMLDLNINAIRIGSHVEQRRFYELCDSMGFLVWQVFPLHWGNYADSDDLIERAAPMMVEMVDLLYNHPSLVMWSTFKEPEVYPFDGPRPNLYGRLCEIMKTAGRTADPLRWIHKGDYREGAENVMTGCWGDVHTDFRQVCGTNTPQKVEFGTTHAAPLETAKQILTPEEQWPPDWDRWYYLNYDPVWPYLKGINVDELSGLEELIERSQTWAARQIKESIEYLRQRKWDPTASMFLYFWSDPWPCLGGSGILDYFRRKYKGYESFVTAYTPVLASIEWVKEKHVLGDEKSYEPGETFVAKLWVTNDRTEGYEKAALRWSIRDGDGAALEEGREVTDVPADSSQVVREVSWAIPAEASGRYRMEVELTDGEGAVLSQNWFEFQVASGA